MNKWIGISLGAVFGVCHIGMIGLLAKSSGGPVQTIRVEQAPLKITTDTKPQEPYKM